MSIKGMTPAIEVAGFGLSGDIGGLRRTTYYTPDGRVMKAIPQIRGFVIKDKDGKVIETGTRDANLDRGWLSQMPQVKKLFCPYCDRWHDTQVEIEACKIQQDKMLERFAKQTKQEQVDETESLRQQVTELKTIVEKLLEAQSGKIL